MYARGIGEGNKSLVYWAFVNGPRFRFEKCIFLKPKLNPLVLVNDVICLAMSNLGRLKIIFIVLYKKTKTINNLSSSLEGDKEFFRPLRGHGTLEEKRALLLH